MRTGNNGGGEERTWSTELRHDANVEEQLFAEQMQRKIVVPGASYGRLVQFPYPISIEEENPHL